MGGSGRRAGGGGPDPVRSFERWKKKYNKRKNKLRLQRKQRKRPEWEVEREAIARLEQRYPEINPNEIERFSDFPLSKKTLKGLQEAQYRMVTEIQRQTIGLSLQGKDVLGAAKTGSGKTLAFIVPALERLYRQQWTSMDGLGILIISPTRELAYQTFEVLRKVGKNHDFSAGLIIGGKDLKEESNKIHNINILICTPGRLLQHMDETSYFHASDLQMLSKLKIARSVNILSRLFWFSYVNDTRTVYLDLLFFSTPATLDQNYIVCELQQKINMLYSFLKSHLNKKSIVFYASCKEVQYLFRVFCRLRPGIPVLALHGKQQQMKRMEVYNDFVRKKSAVLFATDIAARGLDFPAVNWVVQFDCPEDANTYIHRVGRTARYKEGGEALLVLLPSEEKGMVQQLVQRKVPINEIKINPEKLVDVQKKMQAFLAQDQELKERAQRCFVSYLRSVFLMKNKEVFDVFQLPLAEYAFSLGLAVAPRVRFLQKAQKQLSVNESSEGKSYLKEKGPCEDESSLISSEKMKECRTHFNEKISIVQSMKGKEIKEPEEKEIPSKVTVKEGDESEELSEEEEVPSINKVPKADSINFLEDDDDDVRELDLLTVKRQNVFGLEAKDCAVLNISNSKLKKKATKTKEAKKILKRKFKVNTKIIFTDEGELVQQWPPAQKSSVDRTENEDDSGGINLDKAKERLQEEDKFDKEAYRKKIKEKHREKRLREKEARREARKKNKKVEEEAEAFLDYSGSEEEFDPSTLPDPDKYRGSDQEADLDFEDSYGELEEKNRRRKRSNSSNKASTEEMSLKRKKAKLSHEDSFVPLDTGLSLAEDEELVLHLLNSHR
uniref:ATP-dependent RNA helicase n=1 Tax=Pelusios castaneus TaxID=367368 RepID=A0A8C8SB68_9SAUR